MSQPDSEHTPPLEVCRCHHDDPCACGRRRIEAAPQPPPIDDLDDTDDTDLYLPGQRLAAAG